MLTETENTTINAPPSNCNTFPQGPKYSQSPPHDSISDPLQDQTPDPSQEQAPDPPQQEAPGVPPHEFTQVDTITRTSELRVYIIKTLDDGKTYYRCDYPNCTDVDHFLKARQTISHIRRVHIKEMPFRCTTWYAPLQL